MSKRKKAESEHETADQDVQKSKKTDENGNAGLKAVIMAGLVKITDCSQRISDQIADDDAPIRDPGYIAKQLFFLVAAAEDIRKSLEAHHRPKTPGNNGKPTEG